MVFIVQRWHGTPVAILMPRLINVCLPLLQLCGRACMAANAASSRFAHLRCRPLGLVLLLQVRQL